MHLNRKSIVFLILGVFALLFVIIYDSSSRKKKLKKYKEEFYKVLTVERFYFSGLVSSTFDMERGQGLICLNKIATNKTSGYQFKVKNNFVASVHDHTIKYIGSISLGSSLGKLDEIKKGDSVNYNIDFNKKITIYRNSKLIFERDAFVYKVHYNNEYKYVNCEF